MDNLEDKIPKLSIMHHENNKRSVNLNNGLEPIFMNDHDHLISKWLIHPCQRKKENWDLWMTFILVVTCSFTPLNIAFDYNN